MKPQTPELVAERIATAPSHYWSAAGGEPGGTFPRFAVVRGGRRPEEVARYLPGNYALMESFPDEHGRLVVIIGGQDSHGWTLDAYVTPRLASGLMSCEEITS